MTFEEAVGGGVLIALSVVGLVSCSKVDPVKQAADESATVLPIGIDVSTGCQYVMTPRGGIYPRMDENHEQFCAPVSSEGYKGPPQNTPKSEPEPETEEIS